MRFALVTLMLILFTGDAMASAWREIVWRRDGELFTASIDGTGEEVLLSEPGVLYESAVFSHNYAKLAIVRFVGNAGEICEYDGVILRCVSAPGIRHYAAWDVDNEKVYYAGRVGDAKVWVVDFSLPDPVPQVLYDPLVYRSFGLASSSDGDEMVIIHDPANWTYNNFIASYDFLTGQETTVYPGNGRRDFFIDYSPTRREMSWGQTDAGCCSDYLDIWVANSDGTAARNLTSSWGVHERVPKFSPDGETIYFFRDRSLWTMDREGNDQVELIDVQADFVFYDVGLVMPSLTCQGFDSPIASGPVTVKKNRVLPLKANLFGEDGMEVTDLEVQAPPVVQVVYQSASGGDAVDVTDQALPAGQGTEGNQFEYTGTRWQYNLKTWLYSAAGRYEITIISGDPTEYVIESCIAEFVIE